MSKVTVTSKAEIDRYYESEDLNQSKLKKLDGDPRYYDAPYEESKARHFVVGQIVDTVLTAGRRAYQEKYYVMEIDKAPSDAVKAIVDQVLTLVREDYEEYLQVVARDLDVVTEEEEILETQINPVNSFVNFAGLLEDKAAYVLSSARELGWNDKWKDDTVVENIVKQASEYYSATVKAEGKEVISLDVKEEAFRVIESIEAHPRTSKLFDFDYLIEFGPGDFHYIFQMPIFFTYRGLSCKALLDKVRITVDSETGRPMRAVITDLKTMSGNTLSFGQSVRSWRYDIQGAWYRLALATLLDIPEDEVRVEFIVESTTHPGKPLVFTLSEDLLRGGKEGTSHKGATLPGYDNLIDNLLYYQENGFEEEIIIKQSKGASLLIHSDFSVDLQPNFSFLETNEDRDW
jgi:hypothetical protein